MLDLSSELVRRLCAGERLALCVVVASRGSTPQERGAKMLVTAAGETAGTLGGGCVEAEVRRVAVQLIAGGRGRLMSFRLDHDYGWDDGLICGGVMDVLVRVMQSPAEAAPFEEAAAALSAGRSAELRLAYQNDAGESLEYVETLSPPPVLVIAGAGHVGQALATMANLAGFAVDVIDDRAEFASVERFPSARRLFHGDIEKELANYPVDRNTFIVIVTRGHRHDGRALAAVIASPAGYVGLIGSRSKIKRIFDDLHAGGVSIDQLTRVHAPIGLEIEAVTVTEIAVSILAELIAVRRGAKPAAAMKLPERELRRWLEKR